MKIILRYFFVITACLAVSACNLDFNHLKAKLGLSSPAKAPVGQVVATVGDREITSRELNAELAGVNTPDGKARKRAEQAALQLIIRRTILADEAKAEGIDQEPDFAIQQQRALDNLLVQSLQFKIANQVPPPTQDEAERFVADNPDIFSERKVFLVDEIQMARPSDLKIISEIQPLKSLDDIDALLNREHIAHKRGTATIDAVGLNPKLVQAIVKLPEGEVFVYPSGNAISIDQIRETRTVPFTGDLAVKYAMALLKQQHAQEAVGRALNLTLQKAAGSVRYNKDYEPPKPPATSPK